MEPEMEGDSGESGDRGVEKKNRENKSENLDEANHVTMLWEKAEGWQRGRNSMEGEPAEGRKVKLRWEKESFVKE